MSKIKAYIKAPGKKPHSIRISNTIENLQSHVGGYIETVTLTEDLVIICNEEGRLIGLPHNCEVHGVDFVGTIIFVGISGDEFCDVTISWEGFKVLFPNLFEEGAYV
jgi:hypothetical protein